MKYISIIVMVVPVLVAGYFAPSFLGKDKGNQAYNSPEKDQNAALDGNSFSVKSLEQLKGSLSPEQGMIERGKSFLLTKVNNRINQLNPFKARIANMPYLKDADKNSLVSEISGEIAVFESFKQEIAKSETKEDVKNVADKIKAEWLKSSASIGRAEDKIVALKENQLILEADASSAGIQKHIDSLKASGKDAKDYEKLLSNYGKKIADAKQDVKIANEKYQAITSTASEGEKSQLMKDKDQLLKSAQKDIRDAYKIIAQGAREDFARRYK